MTEKTQSIEDSVGAYRRWKHGRALDSVLQMRLCAQDRIDLGWIADSNGLTSSEVVRILIFREAESLGLRTSPKLPGAPGTLIRVFADEDDD